MRYLIFAVLMGSLHALSMQEAEIQALRSNTSIQLTEQDVRQNELRHLQAILSWLPEITFESMYAKLQKSQKISHFQRQTHLFSNQLALTQPIFSPELFGDLKLSKIAQEGSLAGKEMVINDTIYHVRILYLDLLAKQKTVDVDKLVINYLNSAYEDEQKKYQAGSSTSFFVSQAKSTLSQEITRYYSDLKNAGDAKQQFVLTLHLDPESASNLQLDETIDIENYPLLEQKLAMLKESVGKDIFLPVHGLDLFSPKEINDWIAIARQNRPELKRSQALVQGAQEKSAQTKIQYLPKISAFVDYGYYQPVNGQFFRQRNDFAGGVQLSWSLFDSFKREAKALEIAALRKAAGIAFQYETEKVEATIRNDLHQIEEALFAYLTADDSCQLSEQLLEETRIRFSSGTATELELQNASRLYAQAGLQSQLAKFNYLRSYFQLRHDAGLDAHLSPPGVN